MGQSTKMLRHRGRAVTVQDFADLAYHASPEVALSRTIAARDGDDAGRVGLVIVARSIARRPIPTLELMDRVKDYVMARCAPTVDLWIAGPDWMRVTVTAQVAPVSLEAAESLRGEIVAALERYLHPLTGGPFNPLNGGRSAEGWDFGRRPHRSELYSLIEAIDGVDHVRYLSVEEDPTLEAVPPDHVRRLLVFSGQHRVSLVSPAEVG